MECIICGCTEEHACQLENGEPCTWALPPLCTNPVCLTAYFGDGKTVAKLPAVAAEEPDPSRPYLSVGVLGGAGAVILESVERRTMLIPRMAREVARALLSAADMAESQQPQLWTGSAVKQ